MGWLTPTVRLVRWWSLLVPVAAASVLSGMVRVYGERVSTTVALVVAAAVAAAAPASLDDAAHELLGPMPTTRRRRVLQRLAIVVPAAVAAWLVAAWVMFGNDGDPMISTFGALIALGIAACCIAARTRPDIAANIGVAAPLVALSTLWLRSDSRLGELLQAWFDHPWLTAFAALSAATVATTDPARPVR